LLKSGTSILVHFESEGDMMDFRYEDHIYSKIFVYEKTPLSLWNNGVLMVFVIDLPVGMYW